VFLQKIETGLQLPPWALNIPPLQIFRRDFPRFFVIFNTPLAKYGISFCSTSHNETFLPHAAALKYLSS
jgi:hypothetical protein